MPRLSLTYHPPLSHSTHLTHYLYLVYMSKSTSGRPGASGKDISASTAHSKSTTGMGTGSGSYGLGAVANLGYQSIGGDVSVRTADPAVFSTANLYKIPPPGGPYADIFISSTHGLYGSLPLETFDPSNGLINGPINTASIKNQTVPEQPLASNAISKISQTNLPLIEEETTDAKVRVGRGIGRGAGRNGAGMTVEETVPSTVEETVPITVEEIGGPTVEETEEPKKKPTGPKKIDLIETPKRRTTPWVTQMKPKRKRGGSGGGWGWTGGWWPGHDERPSWYDDLIDDDLIDDDLIDDEPVVIIKEVAKPVPKPVHQPVQVVPPHVLILLVIVAVFVWLRRN